MILFKNISLIACVVLTAFSVLPCNAREMRINVSEEARATVTEQKLSRDIGFLSDSICAGRATGTKGAVEASSWIARRFSNLGMQPLGGTFIHSFSIASAGTGRNVIALMDGNADNSKGYILIMASYDGLGVRGGNIYPGADSNGSGVVAMLSLAEMMSVCRDLGREYSCGVIFAGLDAKYHSMAGSSHLWTELSGGMLKAADGRSIGPKDVKMVLNIDQVGSSLSPLKSGRKDYLILLTGGIGKTDIQQANKSKGTALDLGFDYYGSVDFTNAFYRKVGEQKVFVEHGIPAAMATSGITMNNNKLSDTVDNLDLPVLKRRIWLLWNWMERVAEVLPGRR